MAWKPDPVKAAADQRRWAAANPDKVRAWNRRKYLRRREEILSKAKQYAAENAEKLKAYRKVYAASPMGRTARNNAEHRRRARKLDQDATATNAEIKALIATATHCAYCARPFGMTLKPTLDHVIPLSKGGPHSMGNLTAACLPCNLEKGSKMHFQKAAA